MEKLLEELKNVEIESDLDVKFYNGVIYALWKLGKINVGKMVRLQEAIELRLLMVNKEEEDKI